MDFAFLYQLGDMPGTQDVREFHELADAKEHARKSLQKTLQASTANFASVCIGEVHGEVDDDIHWVGAYELERDGEPVWSSE